MLIVFGVLVAAAVGGLFVVINGLRRSPEAYEDAHGFHILRKRASGSAIMRSTKQATLRRSGSLTQAEAKL
jgi:hypothetical protein